MVKINTKWVLFSLVFWLFCCQGLFILVQRTAGENAVESIQNQLRQELNFSDFHFLARSISDFTSSGAIKCAVLEKVKPEFIAIINLKYMEKNCNSTPIFLEGSYFDVHLNTLNGDTYRLRFISNNSRFFSMALWGFRLLGIILVMVIIIAFSLKAQKDLIKFQLELDFVNKFNDMALQVSHDIRSPLAALKMATEEIQNVDDQAKKIMHIAIGRIDEISNNLLRKNLEADKLDLKEELLLSTLDSIVMEKQIEFKKSSVSIEFKPDSKFQKLLVSINQVELKRVISNLINNSIEAIPTETKGKILITLDLSNTNTAVITISDNGKGIPKEVINRLGEKGFTFGKKKNKRSGSGLGFYHAKSSIEKFGGELAIESELGNGTVLKIFLPCTFPEKALSDSIDFYDCVLLDNDELVRLTWYAKAKKNNIKLLVIKSTEEFNIHRNQISKKNTAIYIDSELGENQVKGEEFAQILFNDGYQNLTLATGHSKEKFTHLPWLKCIGKTCPF